MAKPKALDLFCGAGGASLGLSNAGFEVWGLDVAPQPAYIHNGRFVQGDALAPPFRIDAFDLIWASPPCQRYSSASHYMRARGKEYLDLIGATRALLEGCRGLSVIENVPQAPLRRDLTLDGTMFPPLRVIRRRIFELNFFALEPSSRYRPNLCQEGWSTVAGHGRQSSSPVEANAWNNVASWRGAMGIDWMTGRALAQAVPPAYSEFIGRAALAYMERG